MLKGYFAPNITNQTPAKQADLYTNLIMSKCHLETLQFRRSGETGRSTELCHKK